MAAYNNPGAGQDDSDPYADARGAQQEPKPSTEGDEATATLPKSILMGKTFAVGDELVLVVTGIGEDEIQVKYSSEHKEPHEEGNAAAPERDEEMASMLS